jgi:hypothetical protein
LNRLCTARTTRHTLPDRSRSHGAAKPVKVTVTVRIIRAYHGDAAFESKRTGQTNTSSWLSITGRCGSEFEGRRLRDPSGNFRCKTVAENGEIVADSADGYRHQGYAITRAKKLNPGAELVIDDDSED